MSVNERKTPIQLHNELEAATPLGRSLDNEGFWRTVIRFFVANPMLDTGQEELGIASYL